MSPRPATRAARRAEAVEHLLRDLGPGRLRRGALPAEPLRRFPTGSREIDHLLGGGFARGRLSEIAGGVSSGRTALALALLAETTRAGEVCAVVDPADGFDPGAAASAGVDLARVLWTRAPGLREALRAVEHVLEAEGFGLVLLNLPARAPAPAAPAWLRLTRAAEATPTALVTLTPGRSTGSAADVALEMRTVEAHFTGAPALLEAVEVEARLVRGQVSRGPASARLRLAARAASGGS